MRSKADTHSEEAEKAVTLLSFSRDCRLFSELIWQELDRCTCSPVFMSKGGQRR